MNESYDELFPVITVNIKENKSNADSERLNHII